MKEADKITNCQNGYEPVLKIMLATNSGQDDASDYVRYDYTLPIKSQLLVTDASYDALKNIGISVDADRITVKVGHKEFPLGQKPLSIVTHEGSVVEEKKVGSGCYTEREYVIIKLGKRKIKES